MAHRVEGTATIKTNDTTNNASASGTGEGTSTMVLLLRVVQRHQYHP